MSNQLDREKNIYYKINRVVIILLLLLAYQSFLCAGESCVIDDLNTTVCVQKKSDRIVSLSPHITELIYAIGAGKHLTGVMMGSDYPAEAANKTVIGNYQSVSLESIIQIDPDLIVSWPAAVSSKTINQLKKYGFTIYHSNPVSLVGIEENIKDLGILTSHETQAEQLLVSMRNELKSLTEDYKNSRSVSVAVLISERPLMALSSKGLIKEAFSYCGAENIFSELLSEAAMVSSEVLLKKRPDIILITFPVDKAGFLERMKLSSLDATSIVEINPDLILRQTPRFLQGVREFCHALHPDK